MIACRAVKQTTTAAIYKKKGKRKKYVRDRRTKHTIELRAQLEWVHDVRWFEIVGDRWSLHFFHVFARFAPSTKLHSTNCKTMEAERKRRKTRAHSCGFCTHTHDFPSFFFFFFFSLSINGRRRRKKHKQRHTQTLTHFGQNERERDGSHRQ